MYGMRVKNGWIQASTVYMADDSGRPRVILVGISHFAYKGFYRKLNDFVAAKENAGWTVMFETVGFKQDRSGHWQAINPKWKALDKGVSDYGIVTQFSKEGLTGYGDWRGNDISLEQHLRRRGLTGLPDFSVETREVRENPVGWLATRILGLQLAAEGETEAEVDPVREQIAADAIWQAVCAGERVVNLWGAGHTQGLTRRLEKRGLVMTARRWRSFLPALKV